VSRRKVVVLIYGKLEVYDNPFGIHCLRVYCEHDATLSSQLAFETVTFSVSEEAAQVARKILELKPDVVGASCYVWNADKMLQICAYVKSAAPQTLVVAGGPEAGHVPTEICAECAAVDVVVTGEGEETFRQLLLARLAGAEIGAVRGITFRNEAGIAKTPPQPSVDLKSLPRLFGPDQANYLSSLDQKVMYETLRGCPHVCFFCDWGVLTPGRVRAFPIERIERELAFVLSRDQFSHLYLADSEINVDNGHCKAILRSLNRLKKQYGWDGAVTFHLEISKDIDTEMADLLCEATDGIGIGVQSLGEDALYQMGRKWFDVEKFERNVERLERDIHFVFQFIYGCPGDTYRTFADSLKWAVDHDRDIWFDRLQVLPGTIYRKKQERFGIEFDPKRPCYVTSSNSFSPSDIARAEALKRGSLLYNFRSYFHFGSLAQFVGLEPMRLLEAFGEWCSEVHPEESLTYARADPRSLPSNFLPELAGWIGAFIQSNRRVTWSDYSQLRDNLSRVEAAIPPRPAERADLRTPRGN
jgi:radical SAM superfamily enzyme YgiQ (UPF0313 family)